MRQIKFRAWDGKKMIHGYFNLPPQDEITKEWEYMQFTGLLDKNGTEIWESDIVKRDEFRTYKVYWNKDRWGLKEGNGFDYDNGDYYQGDDINNWKEFEVIGNVFENQDILNQLKGGK